MLTDEQLKIFKEELSKKDRDLSMRSVMNGYKAALKEIKRQFNAGTSKKKIMEYIDLILSTSEKDFLDKQD